MGRGPNADYIKKVIAAIRKSPKTHGDLKELGIEERTISRILTEYLEYWGLIVKRDGRWVWYDNTRNYKSEYDLARALEHSKKLALSMGSLLYEDLDSESKYPEYITNQKKLKPGLTIGEVLELKEYVQSHLKTGYPDVFDKLIELRKSKKLYEKNLKSFLSILGQVYEVKGINFKKGKIDPLYEKELPEIIVDVNQLWKLNTFKDIDKTSLSIKIEDREKIENIFNEYFKSRSNYEENYKEFAGNIQFILYQIENGTPLEGKCDLCPRIKIQ